MAAATRFGDLDAPHCSVMKRAFGSPNVLIESKAWSCQSHVNTIHDIPGGLECVTHQAPITIGSTTVKVNGLGAGRIFDPITLCTAVAQGSETVFAGG